MAQGLRYAPALGLIRNNVASLVEVSQPTSPEMTRDSDQDISQGREGPQDKDAVGFRPHYRLEDERDRRPQVGVRPIAEALGYKDIATMLCTYAHIVSSMQREAAEAFDSVLFRH